jgi:transcriptional regulator with XRE-family HTH domain
VRSTALATPLVSADDARIGATLKAIRRRLALTQEAVARAAGVPVRDVMSIEAGLAGDVQLGRIRSVFGAVDGAARLSTWWHGAAADRLLDERHAGLVESALRVLRDRGWETAAEVSFSEFGERGSIDILAGYRPMLALAVGEVKGSIGSMEEMHRMLDVKERLAPGLWREQFGWQPRIVGRVLILPEDRSIRRIVERHAATMATVYPARSREVRGWLRQPDRPLRGIWFLSDLRNTQRVAGQ